jgi:hypothetical protein
MKRYGWDPRRDLTPGELETTLQNADALPAPVSDHLFNLLRDDPASPFRISGEE